uniref:Uncharacterized protein n=1 Tax=Zea mays TaxID=4577 RepID=A0A804N726_MAIZE
MELGTSRSKESPGVQVPCSLPPLRSQAQGAAAAPSPWLLPPRAARGLLPQRRELGSSSPPMAVELLSMASCFLPWCRRCPSELPSLPHGSSSSFLMALPPCPWRRSSSLPWRPPALPPWRPEIAAASPSPKLLLPWPFLPCALLSHGNPARAPFPPWPAPRTAPLRDSPSPNSEPPSSLLVVVPAGCSAKCAASLALQQPSSSFSTSPSRVIALVFAAQRTARRDARRVFAVLRSPVVVVVHPGDNPVFCVEKASRSTLVDVVAKHKSESLSFLQTPIGFVYGPRDDDRDSDVVPTTSCRWWTI